MKSYLLPNKNILDLLIDTAKINPSNVLFIENKNEITRKKFVEKILKVKGGLKKCEIKKGDRVLSLLDNSYEGSE